MEQHNDMAEMKKIYATLIKEMSAEGSLNSDDFSLGDIPENGTYRVPLTEFLFRILEKLKYIILIAVVAAGAMWTVASFLITPKYEATAKIYIANRNNAVMSLSDLQVGSYLTADYTQIFYNRTIHEKVRENLGLHYSDNKLQSMLEILSPSDTRLLYITVTSTNPEEACNIANEYSKVVREFISTTLSPQYDVSTYYGIESELPEVEMATEFERAWVPTAPSSPNVIKYTILGFLVGAFIPFLIFALQIILDDRIRSSEDLENHLGIASLGLMPMEKKTASSSARRHTQGSVGSTQQKKEKQHEGEVK